MTENVPELSRVRSSDHQFLFRKTDQKSQSRVSPETAPEKMDGLSHAFPDMLAGRAFLEKAMAHVVTSDRFGALVIRIDTPEETDAQAGNVPAAVAQAVRDVCDSEKGLWGRLEWDLFGCIFPKGDGDRYRQLAETIQKKLAELGDASVTIGIASFPTIDFPQNRILDNARKALEHAAFFGPGSVVSFDAVSLNISGDQYYQEGDIDGAIAEFHKALELDPENVNVHNSLGVCYGVREEYQKAAASFETASRLDPSEPMSLYNRGLVRLMADEGAPEALRCFSRRICPGRRYFRSGPFRSESSIWKGTSPERGTRIWKGPHSCGPRRRSFSATWAIAAGPRA